MTTTTAKNIRPGMTVQVLNYRGLPLAEQPHRHDRDCRCAPFFVVDVRATGARVDLFGAWDGDFRSFPASAPVGVLS